jgi:hypothetical protein
MQKMKPERRKQLDAPGGSGPQGGFGDVAIGEVCFARGVLARNDHLGAVDLHFLRGQVDAKTLAFESAVARPVMLSGALMILTASV